ncbi:uncharacterized protein LOC109716143 [Ananas comosus]|uniref:Uncharacterized protein LOC109716143 n=1 Tax=Ananas comosus TaxID=4615 RepID=A0A6P5FM80_ANACO|nr:uncharacterized protein LOC109716143 [Ananas comosus]
MKRSCGSRGSNTTTTNNSSINNCDKVERKTIEKNRRMHMKNLSMNLLSLIPKDHFTTSKDALTQLDHLDVAASYIKKLRGRIEKLKQRRESGPSIEGVREDASEGTMTTATTAAATIGVRLPVVEVRYQDRHLEVVLIISSNSSSSSSSSSSNSQKRRFRFHEVISLLEEEGAEVVNANFSVVGDKVFHTIHSQAVCSRIGLEASRVSERLKKLVF